MNGLAALPAAVAASRFDLPGNEIMLARKLNPAERESLLQVTFDFGVTHSKHPVVKFCHSMKLKGNS